jgi:hypothetical protein
MQDLSHAKAQVLGASSACVFNRHTNILIYQRTVIVRLLSPSLELE